MATKKSATKKSIPEKSLLDKIAEQAGHLAAELSVKKDELAEKASGVIASVKETIHNIGAKQTAVAPKKKTATVKKSVKKKVAVVTKKVKKVVNKKTASIKKVLKKTAKKATQKE